MAELIIDDEDEYHDAPEACPYCGSDEECDHLLLVYDRTSLVAEAGRLCDAFEGRAMAEDRITLHAEVEALANYRRDYLMDTGTMTYSYVAYWVSSESAAAQAEMTFDEG